MIYSAHQASFLPWVGFWNKVFLSDVFDVSIHDQFTKETWQHYSFIGNKKKKWGLELQPNFRTFSPANKINQIKVEKNFSSRLLEEFEQEHRSDRYFNVIFPNLIYWLELVDEMDSMWLINFTLISYIKEFLDISTPIILSPPDALSNPTDNIILNTKRYSCSHYLSGYHGKKYLNEKEFNTNNLSLIYQNTADLYKNHPQCIASIISTYGLRKTLGLIEHAK